MQAKYTDTQNVHVRKCFSKKFLGLSSVLKLKLVQEMDGMLNIVIKRLTPSFQRQKKNDVIDHITGLSSINVLFVPSIYVIHRQLWYSKVFF